MLVRGVPNIFWPNGGEGTASLIMYHTRVLENLCSRLSLNYAFCFLIFAFSLPFPSLSFFSPSRLWLPQVFFSLLSSSLPTLLRCMLASVQRVSQVRPASILCVFSYKMTKDCRILVQSVVRISAHTACVGTLEHSASTVAVHL